MARNHDQNAVRQYLLGQLAEDQQENIEKRLLGDDEFFEELEIGEDELVDDYVAGGLSPDQTERFEKIFLSSPERRDSLRFARALKRHPLSLEVEPTWTERLRLAWHSQAFLFRAAAIAAAVVIIAGAFWLAQTRLNSSPTFATLTLTISSGNRAEGVPATKVKLPLMVDRLRLQLKLPEPSIVAVRYRVELIGENGETETLETVSQDKESVVAEVSASHLSRGQYALNAFAIKTDGSEQRIRGSYLLTVE